MKKGLRPKQAAFCREYVKDYNGTQAAIRAGFSKKRASATAAELVAKRSIQEEIQSIEKTFENRIFVSKEKILKELAIIGFADMGEHVTIDSSGCVQAVGLDQLPFGASRAIKKIKEKRVIKSTQGAKDKPSEDVVLESTFEFELHDKRGALVDMGKEFGMFRDRPEHSFSEETLYALLSLFPPEYADQVKKKIIEIAGKK